jgi:RNA polymerase sigma-70 factor (ECF subfamily)
MRIQAAVNAMRHENDTERLRAIAAGDRRALEELYLAYHRRLARFLARFIGNFQNVEEIINDTFMVVWSGAKDFRHASQVSTWIFGIAYRTALKALRSQARTAARRIDEFAEQSVDPTAETEQHDWLNRGLAMLPDEQRLTLELVYHMGYSLEEIAEITDVPVGTVKARMFHAREKLRRHLPALCDGGRDGGRRAL